MRTTDRRTFVPLRALPLLLASACAHASSSPIPPGMYVALECGQGSGQSTEAEIGPAGGTVAVRGHSLTVPPQGVGGPARISITERATAHVGVDVEPRGTRFDGERATLTLSYARCGDGFPEGYRHLQIVAVHPGGARLIRMLPAVVDSAAQTVTAATVEHLGGYLIAGTRVQ